MKTTVFTIFVVCATLLLTGCKSKESAYKQAYEKAKAAEESAAVEDNNEDVAVVTPMVEVQDVDSNVVISDDDDAQFRTEKLSLVAGDELKTYSVVVGSFALKANAEGLKNTLTTLGYSPIIAFNGERNMYRVIATTFDTRQEAVASRDYLRADYPEAWLLYQ